MRLLKLLLVLFMCAAGPAVAGPYDDGVVEYQKGNYVAAARLWRLGAEQGDADAQTSLGTMYENGQGVSKDEVTAASWHRKSAEQGNPPAQLFLGIMYDNGRGVPQDYVLAHMWLNLAASRLAAPEVGALAVKNRDLVARKMSSAQIAEAQKMAREWTPKTGR